MLPGDPRQGSVRLTRDGADLILHVPLAHLPEAQPAGPPVELPATAEPPPAGRRAHAPDFATVVWDGELYTFTPRQRSVVAALWRAREDAYHFLTQEELLEAAESEGKRLRDLFRWHPSWGRLIVSGVPYGGRLGTYRLAP